MSLNYRSFEWYIPQLSVLNQGEAPSPRLGHVAAISGDKMYIFGGHTVPDPRTSQEISNELFVLDLQSMNWTKLGPNAQQGMLPLAYMANTLVVEESKLALFGGLTQDESDSKFKVTNEVLYLDLKTAQWQKPSRVFVTNANDMPLTRMGAQMVNYGDKLWVYSGADPYGLGVQLSDFFSFNMKKGLWKKESSYTELKPGEGTLLGQAIRMYNSNAVIFSGGCSIED